MAENCHPNFSTSEVSLRSGSVTDMQTSKFRIDYTCVDQNTQTEVPVPFAIDDDISIPHLIPEVSDVSADDYEALKSAIVAIERAIGGQYGQDMAALVDLLRNGVGFRSLAGVLVDFNTDLFVPLAGNLGHPMTGPLIMSPLQKTAWGQYCETYAVFATTDASVSLNNPAIGTPVMPFPHDEPGTSPVIPLAIVGHDATPFVAGTYHRRVKIFDDLEVQEDIRAGRDVIALHGHFTNIYFNNQSLDDIFVHRAGDSMTGSLTMLLGSSLLVNHVNGKVALTTPSNGSSPLLQFEDSEGSWYLNSRNGNLYIYKSKTSDVNVIIRNPDIAKAHLAVEGKYRGLEPGGNNFSTSAIDLGQSGKIIVESTASGGSYYGPTASPRHYNLGPAEANRSFDGTADLIDHMDNVNAHHEEIHDLGSHVVYDSFTHNYRSINLPSDINKSFGEMMEDLINHGNADAYHTHAGSTVRWGNLQFSNTDSRTIIEYMEQNYCRVPCGGSGGSAYWDLMPRSEIDSSRIQDFILGKDVTSSSNRLKGSVGFVVTTNSVYGYRPYWSLLEYADGNSTNINDYISGTAGHKKGVIDSLANGYGYMPYWGVLLQSEGGPTIEAWLNANICSILSAQGCGGGGGGGTVRWGVLGKSDSQPTVTIDQAILGTANSGTAVGYFVNQTNYGYLPYWSNLRQSSSVTTTLIDYIATVESNIHTWASSTFCPQSGGCGGGGGTTYWGALAKSNSEIVGISDFITGVYPATVGEIVATTYGYKPYWSTLKRSSSDSLTIEAWIRANICSILSTSTPANCGLSGGSAGITAGQNVGTGWGPYMSINGTTMQFNTLVAGSNITISGNTISANVPAASNATGQNLGSTGYLPYASAANNVLSFNPLTAGTGITITNNQISATASSGVTVQSQGTGTAVYSGTQGTPVSSMTFRSIAAAPSSGITVTESAGTIQIGTSGSSGPKYPLIFPFTVDKTCSDGNCGITGGDTGQSKSTAMSFFQTYYGVTDTNINNYNWFISGGLTAVANTGSAGNVRNFKADVRISGNDFVIDWKFLDADALAYNIKWSGIAIAIHI